MSLPSPTLSVPSLTSDQLSFQGLTLGAGTPFGITKIDGVEQTDSRTGNTDRPRTRGAFVGLNLAKSRTITLTLDVGPYTGPVAQITNLVPNPSFEYDTVGSAPAGYTTSFNVTPTTYAVETNWASHGSRSLQVASGSMTGAQQSEAFINGPVAVPGSTQTGWAVSPSDQYYLQADWFVNSFTGTPYCYLEAWWYTSSGTFISASTTPNVGQTNGQSLAKGVVITAPASAAYLLVSVTWGPITSGTVNFNVDGVLIVKSGATVNYFDGDSTGYEWSGAKGNSSSVPVPGWGTYGPYGNSLPGALAALRTATTTEGTTEYPLWLQLPGFPLVCTMARVTKKQVPWDITADIGGLVKGATIQFEATDPYFYAAPTLDPSIGLPTPGIGFTFPITFPLNFGGGTTANQVTVTNNGDVNCWPVLVITGPCLNPTVSNLSVAGNPTITLGIQLNAGDTLVIDNDLQSITFTPSGQSVGSPYSQILQQGSTFFACPPGSNVISFNSADTTSASGTLAIWNTSAYSGLT